MDEPNRPKTTQKLPLTAPSAALSTNNVYGTLTINLLYLLGTRRLCMEGILGTESLANTTKRIRRFTMCQKRENRCRQDGTPSTRDSNSFPNNVITSSLRCRGLGITKTPFGLSWFVALVGTATNTQQQRHRRLLLPSLQFAR